MITAGEVLKNKRENLGRSLDTASLETKIQKRFLQYIENDEFFHFDSEVFLTGFIKIYAQYLDLDTKKILALYRRSQPSGLENQKKDRKKVEKNKIKEKKLKDSITPKTITTVGIALFLVVIFAYVGIQIYKFQSPPKIEILEPTNETTVATEEITLKGETEIGSTVEINDKLVDIDENGFFEKEIILKEGINIVTIKAKKNRNNTLESVETVKITYQKPGIEETEEEEISETNILVLEIGESPTWIKLNVDDENKISEVLEPGRQEFTVFSNLYIITGRVNDTKLYWNDVLVEWKPTQKAGVAELNCVVSENQLTCE